MPVITLPDDGEENWSGELRTAILAVNATTDENKVNLESHVASENPHPEYDDLPSFSLFFESAL